MPITQIPFQDPAAPPEKPQPEQLGLYDARDWETAFREQDHHIPHLLIQLQDDLARSRKREAAWISIIVHLVLIILVANATFIQGYLDRKFGWRPFATVQPKRSSDRELTYLELPPDAQKLAQRPKTNIASDKNRIAMSRHPELDPKELRKILATPPPGRPGPSGQPQPQQAPPTNAQSISPVQQQGPQGSQPPAVDNQTAQLHMPPRPSTNPFKMGGMSAGSAVQEAARAAAAQRNSGGGGQEGDFGLGTGAHGRQVGALDILSDTQGVDFGPYLQRVLHDVREAWYLAIPVSAQMKKGKLAIEFAIMKDGSIAGMKLVASSGDVALDRAAWAGIVGPNPFPPLPPEFNGQYLALRFRFYYNPDKGELENP